MGDSIRFFEVGPRDGLQNESRVVDPSDRVALIERLVDAGVEDIEIGSFVHPKWVPQMAGTDQVASALEPRPGVRYWGLVPNQRGLQRALDSGLTHVALVMSATESHNQSNLNRSLQDSLRAVEEVSRNALAEGLTIRTYISTVFGCPFEGDVDFDQVLKLGEQLLDFGAEHISLGDTIGAGDPRSVADGCRRAVEAFGADRVALHLHDTRGLALVNAFAAFEVGVRLFDGAVGGMGGCPYAPGAAGNVASEDLLQLLDLLGADLPVSAPSFLPITTWLRDHQGFTVRSRAFEYSLSQEKASS